MWSKDEACPIKSYLPWSATINCTIHLQLICQRPSRDCVGSSLRPKHTLTILYEVGCICLGNCLNPLTRGLHQLSYPQREAYACFFLFFFCGTAVWKPHLAVQSTQQQFASQYGVQGFVRTVSCYYFLWRSHCYVALFSFGCQENGRMSVMSARIKYDFFYFPPPLPLSSVAAPRGTECSWKWNWKVVWFFF